MRRLDFSLRSAAMWLLKAALLLLVSTFAFFAFYYAMSTPPMHWFYEVAPPAGPLSLYIPGGGFAGFWFHLGFLHSVDNLHDYNYYCYSSGCLGIVSVLMNLTMEETAYAGTSSQEAWVSGNISRFDMVEHFVDLLLPDDSDEKVDAILPQLKILVTTTKAGFQVKEAQSRQELKDYLLKTTWVPYLTGRGILSDGEEWYFDGGFSRLLHPKCEFRLDLPLIWETLVHTFSPGLTLDQVGQLYRAGQNYDFGLPGHIKTDGRSMPLEGEL